MTSAWILFFVVFSYSLDIAHSQILGFSCTSSTRFCPNIPSEISCNTTNPVISWELSGDIEDEITFGALDPVGTNETSDQNDGFTAIKTGSTSFILKFTNLIEFVNSVAVTCTDQVDPNPNTNDDSCTIMIYDTLSTSPTIPVPGYTDISFNSVTLSWNPSTEQCIDHYNITVTRNNMNPVDMISDTTSYVYPIDRGVEYCFIVSVVDGANRRGPDSMSRCLTAEVPEVPDITPRPTNYPDNPDNLDDPVEVFIDTEQPDSSRPEILEYIVIHDVNINITTNTITLPSPTTTTILTGAIRGSVYTIQVQPSNTLGTGNVTSTTVAIPSVEPPPIMTSMSPSMTMTMSTSNTPSAESEGLGGSASSMTMTMSTSTTPSPESTRESREGLGGGASSMTMTMSTSTTPSPESTRESRVCTSCSTSIALSVVLTFILTAVISVIISSLVTFLCTKSYYSKSQEPNIQSEPVEQVPMYEVVENIPSKPQTTNMSLTTNPAYGHVQH